MNNFINIQTFGCTANQNNSEILKGILMQSNYQLTNNPQIADILILNTCIVKQKTENKIKRKIQDLTKNSKTKNKLIIITGCMSETDAEQIKKLNPKAILLGTHHFKDIVKLIRDYQQSKLTNKKQKEYLKYQDEQKLLLPKIPNNKLISITQILEGCRGDCSYCKTKLAKGPLFSYNQDDILKSIKSDLQQGAKEIWLTSQDCAAYGLDKHNISQLPELLKQILLINKKFKLRLGMSNPNHILPILDQLIEIYKSQKLYKFLHIPIQSASDKLLTNMNRKYKIKQVKQIIIKFKKEFPDITIATDIISAYPTETQKDHEQNIKFIKTHKPDVFNLSKFSSHKNTKAGKLKPLLINTINKRTTELMQLHRQTAQENKQKFLNQTLKVFINNKTKIPNIYEARDPNYNIVFIKSNNKNILGKNLNVKIKQIGVHHMIGEIIEI